MITVPPPSSCPASPTSVSLMLRIRLKRKVRLHVSRLIISQRLGILNTLIQSCTRTMKAKKNAQREAIAVNLAHRMVHLYMFGTQTINSGCFALVAASTAARFAHKCPRQSRLLRSCALQGVRLLVPARALNRMSLASARLVESFTFLGLPVNRPSTTTGTSPQSGLTKPLTVQSA